MNKLLTSLPKNKAAIILLWCLLITVVPAHAQTATPNPLAQECRQLMQNPAPLTAEDAPTIRIAAPEPDAVFYGSEVAITVTAENFDFAANGEHWHLWIDDQLVSMMHGATAFVFLEPGTYRVCALLSDAAHLDVGQPDAIWLTVREAGQGTPKSTLAIPAGMITPINPITRTQGDEGSPLAVIFALGAGLITLMIGMLVGMRFAPETDLIEDDEEPEEDDYDA